MAEGEGGMKDQMTHAEAVSKMAEMHEDCEYLRTTMRQVLADAQAQEVLAVWWPMMERALGSSCPGPDGTTG